MGNVKPRHARPIPRGALFNPGDTHECTIVAGETWVWVKLEGLYRPDLISKYLDLVEDAIELDHDTRSELTRRSLREALLGIDTDRLASPEKCALTLGFVQGVLYASGILTLDDLNDDRNTIAKGA